MHGNKYPQTHTESFCLSHACTHTHAHTPSSNGCHGFEVEYIEESDEAELIFAVKGLFSMKGLFSLRNVCNKSVFNAESRVNRLQGDLKTHHVVYVLFVQINFDINVE